MNDQANPRENDADVPEILIVGAGMGGLTAALTALVAGARVTVVEKSGRVGGSAALANGMLISYRDFERFRAETPGGNDRLQEVVHSSFRAAAEWLGGLGVEIDHIPSLMGRYYGWSFAPDQFIAVASAEIARLGGRIETNTAMRSLVLENGAVVGIIADSAAGESKILADSVILASGGYQGSPELLAQFALLDANRVNHRSNPWSTGDGLSAALDVGAGLSAGLGGFYGHAMPAPPARHVSSAFAELAQYYGGRSVAINMNGDRFVDETAGAFEENVNHALSAQPGGLGFYVFDNDLAPIPSPDTVFSPPALVADRAERAGGTVVRADSLPELAARLAEHGVPERHVLATFVEFAGAVADGQADRLPVPRNGIGTGLSKAPFTAVHVKASITFTTGGIRVDEDMRVVERATSSALRSIDWIADEHDFQERVIPGLYAIGSDIGGVSCGGYAGGLGTALTTGRIAGRTAVQHPV